MPRDVVRKLVRAARHLRRLGGGKPRCALCPETDPRALEVHHVHGRNHGEITVILCKNHHAKVSDLQQVFGADLRAAPSIRERLPQMLRSQAALLGELLNAHLDWADELERDLGQSEQDE